MSDECPHNTSVARHTTTETDGAEQASVNDRLHRLFNSHPSRNAFRQFSGSTESEYTATLTAIGLASAAAGDDATPTLALNAALSEAERLMADVEHHPELVKHALGVFWTHSTAAQAARIAVPHLGQYRQLGAETPALALFEQGKPSIDAASTLANVPSKHPSKMVNHAYATITGDTFGPGSESLLAYWREDFDFNDHHMHWHMVYPGNGIWDEKTKTTENAIDRKGELFLYMHSQIVSRYDQDRLCWGLPLTKAWTYDDVLEQDYTPVPPLRDGYGARPPMHGWYQVRNPKIPDFSDAPFPIDTLTEWRLNLLQAIKDKRVHICKSSDQTQKAIFEVRDTDLINWVGNIVEAAPLACQSIPGRPGWEVDTDVYGNLHNFGHDKFAEIGYHDYRTDVNPLGLMISNFGSPRDPCFYPWHRHIATFRELASEQYPQDVTAMAPGGVSVTALAIELIAADTTTPAGGITTFMGPPSLEYSEANAKLDHEPYQWRLTLDCPAASETNPVEIDVRLFVVCDVLKEKRHTYIEMDKWPATLTEPTTVIVRTDMESATVRKIDNYAGSATNQGYTSSWCLCGWPRNLMLPAGTPEGFSMQAFCCVTTPKLHRIPAEDLATPSISYCGAQLKERVYPDDLGMGYPFDRTWQQQGAPQTASLTDVIDAQPNMRLTPFRVYRTTRHYEGQAVPPSKNPIEWSTIHGFFRPQDASCMKAEYGYDFNSEIDVTLHAAGIYDALSHHRMPKDGVFWTQEMLDTFFEWMHQPVSKDIHDRVASRALGLYLARGEALL